MEPEPSSRPRAPPPRVLLLHCLTEAGKAGCLGIRGHTLISLPAYQTALNEFADDL